MEDFDDFNQDKNDLRGPEAIAIAIDNQKISLCHQMWMADELLIRALDGADSDEATELREEAIQRLLEVMESSAELIVMLVILSPILGDQVSEELGQSLAELSQTLLNEDGEPMTYTHEIMLEAAAKWMALKGPLDTLLTDDEED